MKAILIKNHQLEVVEMEDELEEYYRLLECETIDVISRYVGGIHFNFVVDDEGLLNQHKNDVEGFGVDDENRIGEMLYGNILVLGFHDDPHDEEENYGEIESLCSYEIDVIKKHGWQCVNDGLSKPQNHLIYFFKQ
jgi:hypothetical protein